MHLLAFAIPAESQITLAKELIDIPPLVADKTKSSQAVTYL